MELTDRKKRILKVVVDDYIRSAEPVGSKAIAAELEAAGLKVSSATIRNELSDLVEMGYLEQPHTSAGRIPSPKGYRLYVNELMERKGVSTEEAESINAALREKMSELDQVVAKAGQMVSKIVDYPAYAMTDNKARSVARRFELISVSDESFIAVVMLDDNRVKSQILNLQLPVEKEKLTELSHLLNTHFTRIGVDEMNAKLMSLADQVGAEWFLLLSQVVEYAGGLIEKADRQQIFTSDTSQLLNFPEFQDVNKAQKLMSFIVDNKENLPVPQGDEPVQILIGPENVNDALRESSVVVASYDIGENMRGLIGVVGPTRMDYATVAARLSYFAEGLTKMFGKNGLPPKEDQ